MFTLVMSNIQINVVFNRLFILAQGSMQKKFVLFIFDFSINENNSDEFYAINPSLLLRLPDHASHFISPRREFRSLANSLPNESTSTAG